LSISLYKEVIFFLFFSTPEMHVKIVRVSLDFIFFGYK